MPEILDPFTRGYLICALWAENDQTAESGGFPLDANYGIDDFDSDTLAIMKADCQKFQKENAHLLVRENLLINPKCHWLEYAGHDFWLSRRHHGCGYWDGDWEEKAGDQLTEAAHRFGDFYLWVENDKVYGERC